MKPKNLLKPGNIVPRLKSFVNALAERYQQALNVIDEALHSDVMKDKIWAVDLIIKRTTTEESATASEKKRVKKSAALPDIAALDQLSEQELLDGIRTHIQDWEP